MLTHECTGFIKTGYVMKSWQIYWSYLPNSDSYQLRYISRVKWSNPGKGVVPSPTP